MRSTRVIVSFLWLASFLLPDLAGAARSWRAQDPCGMMICCCPQMCRMAKKGRLACHMQGSGKCGIRSATDSAMLFPISSVVVTVEIKGQTFVDPSVRITRLTWESDVSYRTAVRSPLDKPPPSLS